LVTTACGTEINHTCFFVEISKDAYNTLVGVTLQLQDNKTVTWGLIWTREYNDGSKDMIVYNPVQSMQNIEGVSSNAVVWLFYADNTGNWIAGRLFKATAIPTFPGFPVPPSVIVFGGTNGMEIQYEITF